MIREYPDVSAAVAPAEGKMTALGLPGTTTAMRPLLLVSVSQTFQAYFIVMHVDRAGWHQAKDLVGPENIRLIAQPASGPAVNPVEPLWEDWREKPLPHVALATLDEVLERVCDGLRQLEADPERLRSMTYFPHFRFTR